MVGLPTAVHVHIRGGGGGGGGAWALYDVKSCEHFWACTPSQYKYSLNVLAVHLMTHLNEE